MATTGPKLTIPFVVGAGKIVGQGNNPELLCLYTTDAATVTSPTWSDATGKVRAFSVSRGRETELDEDEAGTATVTLDNRAGTFWPASNPLIRPMNRWWLRSQFSGETLDLFYGYAESYHQSWPGTGVGNAECVVQCADEFKPLALANLPTTSPPRSTYADVVAFDNPSGYWAMNDVVASAAMSGSPGMSLIQDSNGLQAPSGAGAIVGEEPAGYVNNQAGDYLRGYLSNTGDPGDVSALSEMTIEAWLTTDNNGITKDFIVGPTATGASSYRIYLDGGAFKFETRNSTGTVNTLMSGALAPDTFYHVVGAIKSGTKTLYVNGVAVGSAPFSVFAGELDAGGFLQVGDSGALTSDHLGVDNMAFYRYGLSATTVANHYTAGALRGFARGDLPGARVNRVLDAIGSTASRTVGAGTTGRFMTGSYMVGQPPLDELRKARQAENVDARLFISRSGAVVFLDGRHRLSSPYNTVQATFGDNGTDLPYADLGTDFSESFLTNEWNVTRTDGLVQTASDQPSIDQYFKRSKSLTDIPVTNDTISSAIATALLAKYKNPMERITALSLTTDVPAVTEAALRRDLGDRVRVYRSGTALGESVVGAPVASASFMLFVTTIAGVDQVLFIQKIQIAGQNDGGPWQIQWAVSPL